MVVWSSVYRSVAQPGLLNLYNRPGAIQAIIKNGKLANHIIGIEHTHRVMQSNRNPLLTIHIFQNEKLKCSV